MPTVAQVPKPDPLGAIEYLLLQAGLMMKDTRPIPHGWRVKCETGEIVAVYTSGKVVVGGRPSSTLMQALSEPALGEGLEAWASSGLNNAKVRPEADASTAASPVVKVAQVLPEAAHTSPRRPADWSDEPWDGVSCPF